MKLADRFQLLRYPLIVLVVLIHADNREIIPDHFPEWKPLGFFGNWLRDLISQDIARVAVPLFFAMSAYLFFLGFDGSREQLLRKWKSRLRTLVVPYLAWNVLSFLLLKFNLLHAYWDIGVWSTFKMLVGIGNAPFLYHLWFIRDLILWVALAPLWYVFAKRVPWLLLIVCAASYYLRLWEFPRPNPEGLFFFAVGAVLGLRSWQGVVIDRYRKFWIGIYVAFVLADSVRIWHGWAELVHRSSLVFGCIALLAVAGIIKESKGRLLQSLETLGAASFFLYASHEPFLRYIRYGMEVVMPRAIDAGAVVTYVVPAFVAITVCTGVYYALIRRAEWSKTLFAGGR